MGYRRRVGIGPGQMSRLPAWKIYVVMLTGVVLVPLQRCQSGTV